MSAEVDSPHVIDVTEADFMTQVVERSQSVPVVVDFWAPWCGPCRMLGPMLEALAQEYNGAFVLAKVDVDRSPMLAGEFGVASIPFVVAFDGGRPSLSFQGALPQPELERFVKELCPDGPAAGGGAAAQAEEAVDDGADPAEAEAQCRAKLAEDEYDEDANVGLARLLIARGERVEAKSLLEKVAPGKHTEEIGRLEALIWLGDQDQSLGGLESTQAKQAAKPDDAQLGYELGVSLAAAGQHEQALEALFAAGERDKTLAREKIREAMVHVFHAAGQRSELSNAYRKKLALLLF